MQLHKAFVYQLHTEILQGWTFADAKNAQLYKTLNSFTNSYTKILA